MTALGPLDHLSRPPLLWRAPHLTECGEPLDTIDAAGFGLPVPGDEALARMGRRQSVPARRPSRGD